MRSCVPGTAVLVVDRMRDRGMAMCQAFLREPDAAQVFFSRGTQKGQDCCRVDRSGIQCVPDRPKRILCLVHKNARERSAAERLAATAEAQFVVYYSGSGKQDQDPKDFIHRAISGSKDALAPAEARELVSWVQREAKGNEPSCFSPSQWPRSLVGVYLGLVACTRGVDILDSLAKHFDNAEEEVQQLVPDSSRDPSNLRWAEFDRDAPENKWEQVAVLRARISELAGGDDANFFTPWAIYCEGERRRALASHELVDKVSDLTTEEALRRLNTLGKEPDFLFRLRQVQKFGDDILAHFASSQLVDHCPVFVACTEGERQSIRDALTGGYFENTQIVSIQSQFNVAITALVYATQQFQQLSESSRRANESECDSCWNIVVEHATDLSHVLDRMPRGVVFP